MHKNQDKKDFTETMPNIIVGSGFNDASLGLGYYTLDGVLMHANPALEKIFGYSAAQMAKMHYSEITHPNDLHKVTDLQDAFLTGEALSGNIDVRCFNAKGETLYLGLLFSVMRDDKDVPKYMMLVAEDRTDRLESEKQKNINRIIFETVAEHSPTTVWLSTVDWNEVLYVNDAFCEVWGLSKDEILNKDGRKMLERIHPDDVQKVKDLVIDGPDSQDLWSQEFRLVRDNGEILHIEDRGRLLRDENGEPLYLLGTHHDVTSKMVYMEKLELLNSELQKAYDKVKKLSEYDSLTNCLNRAAMINRLSDALYQYNRYEIPATIIYLDLNGFKQINDKYGHYVGDQVLINFVENMQTLIRQTDILGRMGGDEFLLLLPGANHISAEQFLLKNQKQFDTSVDITNKKPMTLSLNYSAGIAEIDFAVNNIDEWIDIADRAMYVDKISAQ